MKRYVFFRVFPFVTPLVRYLNADARLVLDITQSFNLRQLRLEDFNVDALIEEAFDSSGLSQVRGDEESESIPREDCD